MSAKRFTISHKLSIVKAALSRDKGAPMQLICDEHNVSAPTLYSWIKQYKEGLLTLDNAIAISRKPDATDNGSIYVINGKRFHTKDECIRYAVEKLGGITLEITQVKKVNV